MKVCTSCLALKPIAEFYKRKASSDSLQPRCKVCERIFVEKWRTENRDVAKKRRASRYLKNKDRDLARCKIYRLDNKSKSAASVARWKKENSARTAAHSAKRKALQRMATPNWADVDKINKMYENAYWLTVATGVAHHVDHIVPLVSKIVCGLHNEFNLQVLSAKENMTKKNLYWPDMP